MNNANQFTFNLAFIPKQEIIENTEEEEQTGTNSFCENIIEDDDGKPRNEFGRPTLKHIYR